MIPEEKSNESISCWECGADIVQYFEAKYGGTRGKCLVCEIDFPLD